MTGRYGLVVACALVSGCNLLLGNGDDDIAIVIEPPNLDFGAVVVANESAPVELALIAIANTGPLDISLEGSTDFELRSNPCNDRSMVAGEICRVELVFTPETPEARTGALVVAGQLALLGGFGIEDRGFDFTPSIAAFGPLPLGEISERDLTLENNSGSPAVLELELDADSVFSIKNDTCSNIPLAPELSCSVTLSFQPDRVGSFAGGLRAVDTAESELVSSASISGEGVVEVRTLSVQVANKGRVVSSPAGIDCSDSGEVDGCSASFALGETVSLEATAGLESWEGDCANVANTKPCVLVMDTDLAVTARFTDCSDGGPTCAPTDGGLLKITGSVR